MISIKQYGAPPGGWGADTPQARLAGELEKALARNPFRNPHNVPMALCLLWRERAEENILHVAGWEREKFPPADDIQMSCLRADVNLTLSDEFAGGEAGGMPFTAALIIGEKNPFEKREKAVEKESDRETLNVLPVAPRFTLEKMVLSPEVEGELKDAISLVNLREKIYREWGFEEVDAVPRAILNFYGPPGTGKTMAAHALAAAFGRTILALNYADIESKFVGDAPKNLVAAFKIAKEHDALLFFDEADSFLGKRISNITHSTDQAVNSLRSQLLMLLEEFEGVVVFATNLMENYDKAFNSRILKHIHFELPTFELRRQLIRKMIPARMPLAAGDFGEEQIAELAQASEGFSGREIKNAMLSGIVRSARERDAFSFEDAKAAFAETKKTVPAASGKNDGVKDALGKKIRRSLGWKGKKKNARNAAARQGATRVKVF